MNLLDAKKKATFIFAKNQKKTERCIIKLLWYC